MIAKHQSAHCFYDRHCSRKNTWIMASARSEPGLPARPGHRFLFVTDCSRWLKRYAKINLLPITDAALDAAGIIACRANSPTTHLKWIVMLRAPHLRRGKAGADLESFCCRNTKHGFSQIRFELVENRLTKSGRNAAHDAFNNTANRIAFTANLLNEGNHLLCRRAIRATNDVFFDVFRLHRRTIEFRDDFVNLRDVSDDLEFRVQQRQYFFCNGTSCYSANGLARRSAAAPLPVSNSILGFISEVGMRGSKFLRNLDVIFWTRIFVAHQNRDGRAQCFALKDAGENFALILFFPLRCDPTLTRTSAVQLILNFGRRQLEIWRASVDYNAHPAAMRFAKSGRAKELAEAVSHCVPILI